MTRERIDWEHLAPLPRKKHDGATRDDLAARKFLAHKAKHRGRNHVQNWKRRQTAQAKSKLAADRQTASAKEARAHIALVRAYWRFEIDSHP